MNHDLTKITREVWARHGASCIYAEKRWIAHASISVIQIDDSFMKVRVTALPSPGFTPPEEHAWEAGVALKHFRFSPDVWMGSPYISWVMAFDQTVLTSMIETAQGIQRQSTKDRAMALRKQLAELAFDLP